MERSEEKLKKALGYAKEKKWDEFLEIYEYDNLSLHLEQAVEEYCKSTGCEDFVAELSDSQRDKYNNLIKRRKPVMIMDDSGYVEWYQNKATPDELRLVDKLYDFDDLFEDMIFQEGTSTYELIKCNSKLQGAGWIDDVIDLPYELSGFSYSFFHYKVEPLEGYGGSFDPVDQTLTVTPETLENDSVILHEMIHLYEFVIDSLPMYFHDMVYWALFKDLKQKIPKLDEIISDHAHLLTGSSLYSYGGCHDILFLLKSFDLDIRKDYPLGTVFSYGRDKELKAYSYKKDDK